MDVNEKDKVAGTDAGVGDETQGTPAANTVTVKKWQFGTIVTALVVCVVLVVVMVASPNAGGLLGTMFDEGEVGAPGESDGTYYKVTVIDGYISGRMIREGFFQAGNTLFLYSDPNPNLEHLKPKWHFSLNSINKKMSDFDKENHSVMVKMPAHDLTIMLVYED
ncbi:MAG: hypothetical protein FWH32_07685 [Clostridiales bacterium]|nr:hypothetical protein [Clostridiales bacterium]